VVDNRHRVNLDQVLRSGQRFHTDERVDGLVGPEQHDPSIFDHRQVFRPVVNNEDCELGHLIRSSTSRRECTAKIGEDLTCLDCQVIETDDITLTILRLLAGDEDKPATSCHDHMGVGGWSRKIRRIDLFKGHRASPSCVVLLYGS